MPQRPEQTHDALWTRLAKPDPGEMTFAVKGIPLLAVLAMLSSFRMTISLCAVLMLFEPR